MRSIEKNISKLYFINFFNKMLLFGTLTMPYYLDLIKLNYTKAFILEAIFMLAVFLFEIPTGVIADKYGRKLSLILASATFCFGWLIFGLYTNYYLLVLGQIVVALAMSFFSGADKALLYDTLLVQHKAGEGKQHLARYDAFGAAGIIIGLLVGPFIISLPGFVYPKALAYLFSLTGLVNVIALLISFTLIEPNLKKHQLPRQFFMKAGLDGFITVFRHIELRGFALNASFISAVTFFIFWFYQPLLGTFKLPLSYYGLVGAGFNCLGIFLLINVKRLEKFFGIAKLLFYSAFLPGLGFLFLGFSRNLYAIICAIFMISAFKMFREPILQDSMNQVIESENRATVLSGISMLEKIIRFSLYPLIGLAADVSLHYALFVLGGITLALSLFLSLPKRGKKDGV